MMNSDTITLGYELDAWHAYSQKKPIRIDISDATNCHALLLGMSGSGKTLCLQSLIAKLYIASNGSAEFYLGDFKCDDSFQYLHQCPRYYSFYDTLEALETVHDRLLSRQSGEDTSRTPIYVCIDEYVGLITGLEKKRAEDAMKKISALLLMGRSLNLRVLIACQRPDAAVFALGSRTNFGVVVFLGGFVKSSYEMFFQKEDIERISKRKFSIGEGTVLMQNTWISYLKIPLPRDLQKVKELCKCALS